MGLKLLHLNLHGLIRSHDLELGRDSDTGGQTLYVLELVKELAASKKVDEMKKIIDWHKSFVERAQKQLGLSTYALYLLGILEGALYMWIILKVIPWFFRSKSVFPDF